MSPETYKIIVFTNTACKLSFPPTKDLILKDLKYCLYLKYVK